MKIGKIIYILIMLAVLAAVVVGVRFLVKDLTGTDVFQNPGAMFENLKEVYGTMKEVLGDGDSSHSDGSGKVDPGSDENNDRPNVPESAGARHIVVGDELELGDRIYVDREAYTKDELVRFCSSLMFEESQPGYEFAYLFGIPNIEVHYFDDAYWFLIGNRYVWCSNNQVYAHNWCDLDWYVFSNDANELNEGVPYVDFRGFPTVCASIDHEELCSIFYILKGGAAE